MFGEANRKVHCYQCLSVVGCSACDHQFVKLLPFPQVAQACAQQTEPLRPQLVAPGQGHDPAFLSDTRKQRLDLIPCETSEGLFGQGRRGRRCSEKGIRIEQVGGHAIVQFRLTECFVDAAHTILTPESDDVFSSGHLRATCSKASTNRTKDFAISRCPPVSADVTIVGRLRTFKRRSLATSSITSGRTDSAFPA